MMYWQMIGRGCKMIKKFFGKVVWVDSGQTKVISGELRFDESGFVTIITDSGRELEINRSSIIAISKKQIEGFSDDLKDREWRDNNGKEYTDGKEL